MLSDPQQFMDEFVEIKNDISVEIIDCVYHKKTRRTLNFIHICKIVSLQCTFEARRLLLKLVVLYGLQILFNIIIFDFHCLIYFFLNLTSQVQHFYFAENLVEVPRKVIGLKFILKLEAPFGQYPQNGWVLYLKLHVFYLALRVLWNIFLDFTADSPRSAIIDFLILIKLATIIMFSFITLRYSLKQFGHLLPKLLVDSIGLFIISSNCL